MFTLHPQLQQDCITLGNMPLSTVLLMNDNQYPWLILVPRRPDIHEIYQLNETDQLQLLKESSALGQQLMETFQGDKLNVAALGNMVPQLHLHHVVRYKQDPAWPKPIWGQRPAIPYTEAELQQRVDYLKHTLSGTIEFTVEP